MVFKWYLKPGVIIVSIFGAHIRVLNGLIRLRIHRCIFISNYQTSNECAPLLHCYLFYSLEYSHDLYFCYDNYNWYHFASFNYLYTMYIWGQNIIGNKCQKNQFEGHLYVTNNVFRFGCLRPLSFLLLWRARWPFGLL